MYKIHKLLRISENIPIEEKLFSIVLSFSTSLLSIFILIGFILTPEFEFKIIPYQTTVLIILFYLIKKFYFEKVFKDFYKHVLILIGYILVDLIYFYSNGITGAANLELVLFAFVGLLFFAKISSKFIYIVFCLMNYILLYSIAKNFPEIVIPYTNDLEREADFFYSGFFVILFISLATKFFKDAYDLDREKIIKDNSELKILNEEIKLERNKSEQLAKSKSEFLARMSHEIRTPLNGILGMSESYFFTTSENEKNSSVSTIKSSSKILLSIVNDVLDFSKIESGNFELNKIPFRLDNSIKDCFQIFFSNHNLNFEKVKLHFNIDEITNEIYLGDELRIKQILLNLISNAIKFTEVGEVFLEAKKLEQDQIQINVKDTGIGIKDKSKLFQSYSQENSSISQNFGGTGLGLAISKSLVELMNGKIWVQSEFGKGSTFSFILELQKSEKINNEKNNTPTDKNLKQLSNLKVLLVEDNIVNQKVFINFAKKLSLFPALAENGKIAVEKTKLENFDIIFMDIEMPVMNGIEATEKIRSLNLKKQPFIISLSANVMNENKEECLKIGMNEFMTKPILFEELKNILLNYYNSTI